MSITIIIMASEYFIDHHCEYFFFCERCVNEIERKKATTNIAQPYQDGARGENLRPKIATMAAGRRTTAAPDGQTRRDSFFIANSAGKRTTTLLHEQQLNTRRPRRPRRRESARENRNDGSRATNESGPGRADAPRFILYCQFDWKANNNSVNEQQHLARVTLFDD